VPAVSRHEDFPHGFCLHLFKKFNCLETSSFYTAFNFFVTFCRSYAHLHYVVNNYMKWKTSCMW
jgi:hypothetical protein